MITIKKIYKIFRVADRNGRLAEPFLYAFTDNPDYLKNFKSTRNMKFFCVNTEEMDKREFMMFADKEGYGKKLCLRTYKTKADEDSIKPYKRINLIVTEDEDIKTSMHVDGILEELAKYTCDMSFLENKYLKALHQLYFFDVFVWNKEAEVLPFYDGIKENSFDRIDELQFDQLEVFLFFFGNTMLA